MRILSLALIAAFFTNQALAFYPQSDDLAVDQSIEQIEVAMENGAQESSSHETKQVKIIKRLEKEIQKVETLDEGMLAAHVKKVFKRADKRLKRTSRQFERLAKKQRLIIKLARKSGKSPEEIRQSFLAQSKSFAPEKMIATLKEEIEASGGYLNFLNDQLNQAKRLAAQIANMDHKSGRYVANDTGLAAAVLLALYILITPFLLFGGLIIGLIGIALLMLTGGSVAALAIVGAGIFMAGVPGLIIIGIWN